MNITVAESRKCLECEQVIYGRSDKKFCSDGCRNAFNNKRNHQSHSLIRRINLSLRKNRNILKKLSPSGKSKVHRSDLIREGFDFDRLTHIYETRSGDQYRFCYDFGFLDIGQDFVLIVQREE